MTYKFRTKPAGRRQKRDRREKKSSGLTRWAVKVAGCMKIIAEAGE